MNSDRIFTEIEENNCIIAYTNSVTTQHIQEKQARIFSLICFNFSQRIYINGHAFIVGCLISMRNLCMKLTYSLHKDGGSANELSFEDFIKIGDPQQIIAQFKENALEAL